MRTLHALGKYAPMAQRLAWGITYTGALGPGAAGRLRGALTSGVGQWAKAAVRVAKRTNAFTDRTGALRRSIKALPPVFAVDGAEAGIQAQAPGARTVEWGAKPHLILPVRARVLRWLAQGGAAVFALRVRHPGNAPRLPLTTAVRATQAAATSQLLQGAVRALAKGHNAT